MSCSWHLTPLLEKAMAPHSSTVAWKIPWMKEPGGLQSMGSLRVAHDWATSLSCIGEGNGIPLQCSCLENPRDGGAWWAAIYGVAQSRTRLKWLSSSSSSKYLYCLLKHFEIPLKCMWPCALCSDAQSCLTLSEPLDCSLPSLLCPWDSPGKVEWSGLPFLSPGESSQPKKQTVIICDLKVIIFFRE